VFRLEMSEEKFAATVGNVKAETENCDWKSEIKNQNLTIFIKKNRIKIHK